VNTRVAAALALVLLAGCRHGAASTRGDGPTDLATLADRIDPGPVPPLLAKLPPPIEKLIGGAPQPGGPADRAEAEQQLAGFAGQLAATSSGVSLADVQRILQLFRALAVVEADSARSCDLACLTTLERVYGILDIPWMATDQGMMAQIVDIASTALVQSGLSKREVKEAVAFIRSVFRRAPERHAYIAARLLRDHPDSPGAEAALRRLGNRALNGEDFEQAIRLLATAAARAPAAERAGDLVDLSRACYRALDLACGDRRLAEARRAAGDAADMAERLSGAAETGQQARRVVAARGARSFEDRIALGHMLLDLGRRKDSMALFERLAREHPRDARPMVGLARGQMDQMMNDHLHEYVERARHLENRDLAFYELAVGTAFTNLMPIIQEIAGNPEMTEAQILARLVTPLGSLRADLQGLARFAPARAAVLQVVVDGAIDIARVRAQGDAALHAALDRAWRAALDTRRRFPAEPDAHHLVYLLAGFGAGAEAEREAAVVAEPPADLRSRDAVLEARAGVYLRIILSGALLDRTGRLGELVAAIPATRATSWESKNLGADAVMIAALAGRGTWDAAADAYRALLSAAPDAAERARIENNIGVALHRGGHPSEALAAWDRAMRLGPAYPVPDLNHAAASDGAPYGLERLGNLAESGELAGIQFQAAAWRRHFAVARREGDQRSIAQLRADKLEPALGVTPLDGGLGVIPAGSFKISFGYHSTKRLVVELATESRSWLCLPAPGTAPKR